MTLVIDSLRPNEACQQPPSSNDACRVDASFHTVVENPQTHAREVMEMEARDFLRFRRESRAGQVRFVLDQAALTSVFRGLTLAHGFVPENIPELQAAFNFSISLTPALRDLFNVARQRSSLGPEISSLFQEFIDYLLVSEVSTPDRLQEHHTRDLFTRTLAAPEEYRRILRRFIIPMLEINRNRLSPAIIARFERFRDALNSNPLEANASSGQPSSTGPRILPSPPRVNPHPRVPPSPRSGGEGLPIAEGVLCALGVAGTIVDSVRIGLSNGSDGLDSVFMGASGFAMGLGCTPLVGRAFAGRPRNAWLRDGILGGIGGLSLGAGGALLPLAFPRPSTPMPPPPIEGRNPTREWGP